MENAPLIAENNELSVYECPVCKNHFYAEPGAKNCHVCGSKNPEDISFKDFGNGRHGHGHVAVILDEQNDILVTTCNKCGKKVYFNFISGHPSEITPLLADLLWDLWQKITNPPYKHHAITCPHCGEAHNTKTQWIFGAIRDFKAPGTKGYKVMHDTQNTKPLEF